MAKNCSQTPCTALAVQDACDAWKQAKTANASANAQLASARELLFCSFQTIVLGLPLSTLVLGAFFLWLLGGQHLSNKRSIF